MNSAAFLGQKNWQVPSIDPTCPGYNCDGTMNPMGNLFYDQLGFNRGASVATPNSSVGPFSGLQPYLYWTCVASAIQAPCEAAGPAANFEESYSFGSGFQGTDPVMNDLYVTAYFAGSRSAPTGPEIAEVANAEGESPVIAPNTWVEIKGVSLAPDAMSGPVPVVVTNNPTFRPNFYACSKRLRIPIRQPLPLPVIKIGGTAAAVQFAGLVFPGQYQFNVAIPSNLADGDQSVTATYSGQTIQAGMLITIHH
jgi:hypothetical protein